MPHLRPLDVSALVADVAQRELLTRFRRLRSGDVWEKSAGDVVTTADIAAERRLARDLTRLLPGSGFVGEEGVAAGDVDLPAALAEDRPVWIVDPLDGTSNFVRGRDRFCLMVALMSSGSLLGSWLVAPAVRLTGMAWAGDGAYINGTPMRLMRSGASPLRVVVTDPAYRTDEDRAQIARLKRESVLLRDCDGVGVVYLELVRGLHDAAVFGWMNVWDHAAGLLLYREAGGRDVTGSGAAFGLAEPNRPPLILAPTLESSRWLRRVAVLGA
ncbi:MAG TPA: inositol monophosphatase family protein [Streptosporangiaceae bacterium]|nr:inositol monophosphatase family protein [Streptosporangiaceae bacterium]